MNLARELSGANLITAQDVVKDFSGHRALNNVSLKVPEGSVYGLLGPNGAGKTTAISIMSTLLAPSSGTVKIFGRDISKNPQRVKQDIGLVPQNLALYDEMTCQENLIYFGKMYGLSGNMLNQRMKHCLEFTGLEKHATRRISTFSGGMKRRANLAVGIIHDPKLLFLDEPTVGIDAQSRSLILEKIQHLGSTGTSIIYTTHYLEEAEHLCSTVAVIDGGQIVITGKPQELIHAHNCTTLQDLFFKMTGKKIRD